MPRIFDNISLDLLPALKDTLEYSERADFCVGYFNLRGWKQIDHLIERWAGGEGACCRLLVGMQQPPQQELRAALRLAGSDSGIDNQTAIRLKKQMAEQFREQLTIGTPTNDDEAGLRRLSAQLRARKVVVKLFLRYPLHAKLYLLYRRDPNNPITGFLGSSNLTFAGLSGQGELNVDVLDHDAAHKLARWFDERWQDRWCLDISDDLAEIIDSSWAREQPIPPYYIYLNIAYHLSQEARSGLAEFSIPRDFGNQLFEFQKAAVQIAAHHVNKREGVLIGDVVGLGKTLMATALARIFQDDYGWETLILCPKNLVEMWQDYVERYRLVAKVLSISRAIRELPDLRRYRLVLIDESHNLRNRDGKRYKAIQDYIEKNDSHCVLLTATPYNKTYLDLSAQLRLFVPEHQDLGIRPEKLIGQLGETEFLRLHQCPVRSLAAFEKSESADDWRDLMRLFLVRRTRSFIQANYAETDQQTGRQYLTFADGTRTYFPTRVPRTISFTIDDHDPGDPYARLYSNAVVEAVNALYLPRYGLGNYLASRPTPPPTPAERKQMESLSRAGKRLMGFCRTNLFKRLESGGPAFLQSIERHILRNCVFLHAIAQGLDLPLGTQEAELLDPGRSDEDAEAMLPFDEEEEPNGVEVDLAPPQATNEDEYLRRAAQVYALYSGTYRRRFKWLRASLFSSDLRAHLLADTRTLLRVLDLCGTWDAAHDAKLNALIALLTETHPQEKVLIFTQFADTVEYLTKQLKARGLTALAGVTGASENPTALAWRFSPTSNNKKIDPKDEIRVLVATDVLSEGQNLQDCSIILNYDLPWAIIRLIQRAGRVDRIGQHAPEIRCYSFLPADGVERIIRLRSRVRQRLRENAEVVGADEAFFEGESDDQPMLDLYNEKAGILEGEAESEVDLASQAYQIWKNATAANPSLQKIIPALPPVVFSTRAHRPTPQEPEGVLVYLRTAAGNDALAWMDTEGRPITQSQLAILRAAECTLDTPALPRNEQHHALVMQGAEHLAQEDPQIGGQLGRPTGARFRVYKRLQAYVSNLKGTLFDLPERREQLERAIDDIYRFPLFQTATDTLNRQLKSGISDEALAELVLTLRNADHLCIVSEGVQSREPQLICSLGLFAP
jgi:superfamily II DNA or RNA helicase